MTGDCNEFLMAITQKLILIKNKKSKNYPFSILKIVIITI